jgi:hypothetical protein
VLEIVVMVFVSTSACVCGCATVLVLVGTASSVQHCLIYTASPFLVC